jgi:hypothetical protein
LTTAGRRRRSDRIVQVSHKLWADDATLAGLVRALDDVLRLQSNLCGRQDHRIDDLTIDVLVAKAGLKVPR